MNTISNGTESHDFSTVAELLALPMVAKYIEAPQFDHWLYDGFTIYAVNQTPFACLVGIVKERVVLPLKLQARK